MQLAARGCFENKPCRQVQKRVRSVHGQQVECEGSGTQNIVYGFSLNGTFSALLRDAFLTRWTIGLTQLGISYIPELSGLVGSFYHSLKIIFSFTAGLDGRHEASVFFLFVFSCSVSCTSKGDSWYTCLNSSPLQTEMVLLHSKLEKMSFFLARKKSTGKSIWECDSSGSHS